MNYQLFKNKPAKLIAAALALAVVALLALNVTQQGPPPKDLLAGTVTLDQNGEATVTLPASTTAQDTDFGYQVDSMGAPMPNLYIKSELRGGSFSIAGGAPGGQVAWQLVGVREAP